MSSILCLVKDMHKVATRVLEAPASLYHQSQSEAPQSSLLPAHTVLSLESNP